MSMTLQPHLIIISLLSLSYHTALASLAVALDAFILLFKGSSKKNCN